MFTFVFTNSIKHNTFTVICRILHRINLTVYCPSPSVAEANSLDPNETLSNSHHDPTYLKLGQ